MKNKTLAKALPIIIAISVLVLTSVMAPLVSYMVAKSVNNTATVNTRSIVSIDKTKTEGLIDTYTITYSDETTSSFFVVNGASGTEGIQGLPGQDGHTPTITIDASTGNWVIDGVDSGFLARGPQGLPGQDGQNGQDGRSIISIDKTDTNGLIDTYTISYSDNTTSTFVVVNGADGTPGAQGIQGVPGQDGVTPTISIDPTSGNWVINGVDSGFSSRGPQGPAGQNGQDGRSVVSIDKTDSQGLVDTYTITYSDNTTSSFVVVNGQDGTTGGQGIQGLPGQDGHTPVITIDATTGNWVVDGVNTGVHAQGPKGDQGPQGPAGQNGQDGRSVVSIEKTGTEGLVDTYTITYSDNTTSTFTVTNGEEGGQGIQGLPGQDGRTPVITIDDVTGNWVIDGVNSGVKAQGPQGEQGPAGQNGQDGLSVVSIEKTGTEGLVDTYTITYSDNTTSTFTITNGANGTNGTNGQDGQNGVDGKTLLVGSGAPTIEATVGDSYIDVENWVYYVKTDEGWQNKGSFRGTNGVSITGINLQSSEGLVNTYTVTFSNGTSTTFTVTNGQNGTNGNTLFTGSVDPTSEGVNGDSYLNTLTWEYFVKENGAWVSKGSIRGNDGTNGNTVTASAGAPDDADGAVGDSYIDTTTWNFYVKTDTGWGLPIGNIHNSPNTYTVTFNTDGGNEAIAPITNALEGHKITSPSDPTKDGWYFQGWYTAEGNKWAFEKDVVTASITLYAHWSRFVVADGIVTECSLSSGDVVIPSVIDGQIVRGISKDAFANSNITSISIPDSVTYIEESAFKDCVHLETVVLSNNLTVINERTFLNCAALKLVVLPETVSSIGDEAFSGCTSLNYIYLPHALKTIGVHAFYNCQSLGNVTFFEGLTTIGVGAFEQAGLKNVNLPNSIITLGDDAFKNCANLKSFEILTATDIGTNLLTGATSLETISLPFVGKTLLSNETCYLGYLFGGDSYSNNATVVPTSLKNVYINGDSTLYAQALYGCSSLENVILSGNFVLDGTKQLQGCSSLKTLTLNHPTVINNLFASNAIPTSLNTIVVLNGDGANKDAIGNNTFKDVKDVKTIILPENIKTIGNYAFSGCSSLRSITNLPELETIGDYAFKGCSSLETFNIPNSVTSIGKNAFENCASLRNVIIPNGITSISNSAFKGCSSITSIVIPEAITSIGDSAFENCESLRVLYFASELYLKTIGSYAFSSTALEDVKIPTSVSSIGLGAFRGPRAWVYSPIPVTAGHGDPNDLGLVGNENDFYMDLDSDTVYLYFSSLSPNWTDGIFPKGYVTSGYTFPAFDPEVGLFFNKKDNKFYQAGYGSSLQSISIPFIGDSATGSNQFFSYILGATNIYDSSSSRLSIKTVVVRGLNGTNRNIVPDDAFRFCENIENVIFAAESFSTNITIGSGAFSHCYRLTSISIDRVSTIKTGAFMSCQNLKSVKISNTITDATAIQKDAFEFCESLEVFECTYISSIGEGAFDECSKLKIMKISNTITSIGKNAFNSCSSLELVEFTGEEEERATSTVLDNYAFDGCTMLRFVIFNVTNIKTIGNDCFNNCESLTKFKVPNSTTYIGQGAFNKCTSLVEFTLLNPNTTNGGALLFGCSSLKKLTLPYLGQNGDYINQNTFLPNTVGSNSPLEIFVLEGGNGENRDKIGPESFKNVPLLRKVVLPEGIIEIGQAAFKGCNTLEIINIPNTVKTIEKEAFMGCSSLSYMDLGTGVETIGDSAFNNCYGLLTLVVPTALTTIGENAFLNCNNMFIRYLGNATQWAVIAPSFGTEGTDYRTHVCLN